MLHIFVQLAELCSSKINKTQICPWYWPVLALSWLLFPPWSHYVSITQCNLEPRPEDDAGMTQLTQSRAINLPMRGPEQVINVRPGLDQLEASNNPWQDRANERPVLTNDQWEVSIDQIEASKDQLEARNSLTWLMCSSDPFTWIVVQHLRSQKKVSDYRSIYWESRVQGEKVSRINWCQSNENFLSESDVGNVEPAKIALFHHRLQKHGKWEKIQN